MLLQSSHQLPCQRPVGLTLISVALFFETHTEMNYVCHWIVLSVEGTQRRS